MSDEKETAPKWVKNREIALSNQKRISDLEKEIFDNFNRSRVDEALANYHSVDHKIAELKEMLTEIYNQEIEWIDLYFNHHTYPNPAERKELFREVIKKLSGEKEQYGVKNPRYRSIPNERSEGDVGANPTADSKPEEPVINDGIDDIDYEEQYADKLNTSELFCVNCGNTELDLICQNCHDKMITFYEKRKEDKLIREFLRDWRWGKALEAHLLFTKYACSCPYVGVYWRWFEDKWEAKLNDN